MLPAMTNTDAILLTSQPEPGIMLVTLNRPDAANALSRALGDALHQCLTTLPASTRIVILTGSGRHFCAGADLKERKGMTPPEWHQQHHAFELALQALMECPVPVIAAINGAAYGGGLELALACDFIYASEAARFALTETTLGIIPGMGGTQNLSRAVGMRRAKELIFLGKSFAAKEADSWGMLNRVCLPESLMDEVLETARTIAANAPLAVKAAKQAMIHGSHLSLAAALACELSYYQSLLETKDRHEGINAFNEKRKPAFTGS
jgi:enoyl-CoA hydratase